MKQLTARTWRNCLCMKESIQPSFRQDVIPIQVKMCGRMAHNWLPPSLLWPPASLFSSVLVLWFHRLCELPKICQGKSWWALGSIFCSGLFLQTKFLPPNSGSTRITFHCNVHNFNYTAIKYVRLGSIVLSLRGCVLGFFFVCCVACSPAHHCHTYLYFQM